MFFLYFRSKKKDDCLLNENNVIELRKGESIQKLTRHLIFSLNSITVSTQLTTLLYPCLIFFTSHLILIFFSNWRIVDYRLIDKMKNINNNIVLIIIIHYSYIRTLQNLYVLWSFDSFVIWLKSFSLFCSLLFMQFYVIWLLSTILKRHATSF